MTHAPTQMFKVSDRLTVELKLAPTVCAWPGCANTLCVEGWTMSANGTSRQYAGTQNFELVPTIINEIDRMAQRAALRTSAEQCVTDARKLLADGEHVLAAGMLVRSLEHAVGVGHPLTRWVGAMIAGVHPARSSFARRYATEVGQ